MQFVLYLELNFFALFVLLLIFLNIYGRTEKHLTEQKLFLALVMSNAVLLVLDSGMWFLDGRPGAAAHSVYLFVTVLYYIMNPSICFVWSLYVDYQINRNEKRLEKLCLILLPPLILNVLLSLLSVNRNLLFSIDSGNIYHRGPLFLLMFAISYLYLAGAMLQILANRKKMNRIGFYSLISFEFLPFIAGIIQTMFYGVSLVWICTSISILIIFINIQNNQLYTDYLTGLFNRRQLDNYLQQRSLYHSGKKKLAGIMLDLDSFKMINDLYGHAAGDQALEYTAKILKKSFRKDDFIARYGGDEFIVIMEIENCMDTVNSIDRLTRNLEHFNSLKAVPYKIALSLGYDYVDCKTEKSVLKFLKHIDNLMYEDKLAKKIV